MDKESMKKFMDAVDKTTTSKHTAIRMNGGNRVIHNNTDSGRIILLDGEVVSLEPAINRNGPGPFTVTEFDYDGVDSIFAQDLSVEEAMSLLKELGVEITEDIKQYISARGSVSKLIPGTAALAEIKDENGNATVGVHSPGYVTM